MLVHWSCKAKAKAGFDISLPYSYFQNFQMSSQLSASTEEVVAEWESLEGIYPVTEARVKLYRQRYEVIV